MSQNEYKEDKRVLYTHTDLELFQREFVDGSYPHYAPSKPAVVLKLQTFFLSTDFSSFSFDFFLQSCHSWDSWVL